MSRRASSSALATTESAGIAPKWSPIHSEKPTNPKDHLQSRKHPTWVPSFALRRISTRPLTLGLVTAIGAVLYLHNLGSQPFWLDEALSEAIARSHGGAFLQLAFEREANMALYYVILHVWLALVHPSDFSIRVVSTIFAILALPVFYRLASKLFGQRVGLASVLLFAVNPLFLKYAQEARTYTLTVLLTLISWWFLLKCLDKSDIISRLKYITATTLAVYAHTLAIFIIPAQAGIAFFLASTKSRRTLSNLDSCLVCILIAPLLVISAYWYTGGESWIAVSVGRPGVRALREVAVAFAGGVSPPRIRQRGLEALVAAGFVFYLLEWFRKVRNGDQDAASYFCTVSALTVPIGSLMCVSQAMPLFIVRYVLICLPFYLLIVTVGWYTLGKRWLFATAVALFAFLSVWSDVSYYSHPDKPAWREALAYMNASALNMDALVFAPSDGRLEFDHNLARFGDRAKRFWIVYPQWDSVLEVQGNYTGNEEILSAALETTYKRLWIVHSKLVGTSLEPLIKGLREKYPLVLRSEFPGVSIIFCAEDSGIKR
jgi:4-amino-4-deoxy-L-arabinose transferase-like glycosyltransferase